MAAETESCHISLSTSRLPGNQPSVNSVTGKYTEQRPSHACRRKIDSCAYLFNQFYESLSIYLDYVNSKKRNLSIAAEAQSCQIFLSTSRLAEIQNAPLSLSFRIFSAHYQPSHSFSVGCSTTHKNTERNSAKLNFNVFNPIATCARQGRFTTTPTRFLSRPAPDLLGIMPILPLKWDIKGASTTDRRQSNVQMQQSEFDCREVFVERKSIKLIRLPCVQAA